jgi:hypothetical protein
MNLTQTRHLFRTLSGRYDLTDADSGEAADQLINEGSRYLDRHGTVQKSVASCFRWLEVGLFAVSFPFCRAIKEVWIATNSERSQLEKKSLQDLLTGYMADLPSARDTGTPLYYAPMLTRHSPDNQTAAEMEAWAGFADVLAGNSEEYNAVMIAPPPEEKIHVEIKGLFYSPRLVNDTDKNYWSVNHPTLLCMAAMRQLEVVNRNRAEVTSIERGIKEELAVLEFDLVEEEIAEVSQMEG